MTAHEWGSRMLKEYGIPLSGWVEPVTFFPWAWVEEIPTDAGRFLLQIPEGFLRHEAKTLRLLTGWFPDAIVEVVALEPTEGWVLLRDPGVSLGLPEAEVVFEWRDALRLYAEMQIASIDRLGELRQTGCPSWSLETLADDLEEGLPMGQLSEGVLPAIRRAKPIVERVAGELAGGSFPETLHHDALVGSNVFGEAGRYRIGGWGEAGIAMPLLTLPQTLQSVAATAFEPPEPGKIRSLLHGYREVWTASVSRAEFDEAYALAERVGPFVRALTWTWILPLASESTRPFVVEWLEGHLRDGLAALDA